MERLKLTHEGDNDYKLSEDSEAGDSEAGVWVEVDNLVVWIRRAETPGVQIEVYRAQDIEYVLDTLFVEEVE